jgi:hypothetical protein
MSRALRNAAYALSGLLFTATALAGARLLGDPANGFRTRLDYEDARATSPFLSEARRLVPPEDGVLVVSALVPPPDVDYWFGLRVAARCLAVVERERYVQYVVSYEGLNPGDVPAEAELERLVDAKGELLTRERLADAMRRARWIVCTDPAAAARLLALAPELDAKIRLRRAPGLVIESHE